MPNQYRPGTVMISLRLPAPLRDAMADVAMWRGISVNRLIQETLLATVSASEARSASFEVSPEAAAAHAQNLRTGVRAHRDAMAERRRLARKLSLQLADMLRHRFGVAAVRLVGSMSRADAIIGPSSDIDLLVSGLPAEDLVAATTAAQSMCQDLFVVDLVRREDLTEEAARLFFGQGGAGE